MLQHRMAESSISCVQCSSSVLPEEADLRSSRKDRLRRKNGVGGYTNNLFRKPYVLVFEGEDLPEEGAGAQKINVSSFKEVLFYIGVLGEAAEVYLSKTFKSNNLSLCKEVEALTYTKAKEYVQNNEIDEGFAGLMNKIPLDVKLLMNSPLAMKENEAVPQVLNKRYVHKKKDSNVLISEHFKKGDFLYFNMRDRTGEIHFDHDSDHVQGLLVIEAMRQASIATTHILGGLPDEGTIALLTYDSAFYNFLELTAPIMIRTHTPFSFNSSDRNGDVVVSCHVFQWGKLAASGLLKGKAFSDKSRYVNYRIRTEKIQARHKKQYDLKMSAMQNAERVI